jgi:alpha-tubulin suppressor-like RCC1 family protein
VTAAGGAKCWGWNGGHGQIGDGTSTTRLVPVDVKHLTRGVAAIAADEDHTCAVTAAGGAKCWGWNQFGQIGDGTTTVRRAPVDVVGLTSGVAAIAAGAAHTCALTAAGGVKCWGSNGWGQIGDGTTTDRLTPVDVVGLTSGVAAIAARDLHTCALTKAGGAKCWGSNLSGQIGDGTKKTRLAPVDVKNLTSGVAAIAAGAEHTCALTTAGGVKCWGYNGWGEIGDGTKTTRLAPVDVKNLTSGVAAIAAGAAHTCAVTKAGGAKCWGSNGNGEIGNGTTTDRRGPVDVVGLTSGVAAIAGGAAHTCALTAAGGVKCWGWNSFGQIGDGTTTDRLTPVKVKGF